NKQELLPPLLRNCNQVLLSTKNICIFRPQKKLDPKEIWLYTIKAVVGSCVYCVDLPGKLDIHSVLLINLLE
ncbi:hypothetical protein C7212DRAFT_138465, partial [Tuber magnatum]